MDEKIRDEPSTAATTETTGTITAATAAANSASRMEKHPSATVLEAVHKEFNPDGVAPVTSAFADWSRAACMKKFWRLYMIGLMVSIGGM